MTSELKLDLEEVASGLGFPEGPVAMNDGSVLFVDIKEKTLNRLMPDKTVEKVVDLSGGPNGVAIGPDGAAYICNNGGVYAWPKIDPEAPPGSGKTPDPARLITIPDPLHAQDYEGGSIQRVDLKTKKVTTLYCKFEGKCLVAPNDIVFDEENDGFWFTDSGRLHETSSEFGAVYFATINGKCLKRAAIVPTANGIGLSPPPKDKKEPRRLFVSDTSFGRLWELEITGPGQVKPGQPGIPGKVVQTLPKLQWLDSLKVEEDGRVCVGTLLTGGITIFSEDGETQRVFVPDPFTTNLCFGGSDMRDVWITASSTGRIYKTRWPRPGLKLAYTA